MEGAGAGIVTLTMNPALDITNKRGRCTTDRQIALRDSAL